MFHFRHVATQIKGVAEPHHNGASGWSADPIQVIADQFHSSIALDGVRANEGFRPLITLKLQPSYGSMIGPGCDNRYGFGFFVSLSIP